MAKQIGPLKITGSIDNVCFYKMYGEYYARTKSSLDANRVKEDPVFMLTRYYAGVMGRASKLAASIKRSIPGWERNRQLYRLLLTPCMELIKRGWEEEEIRKYLLSNYIPPEEKVMSIQMLSSSKKARKTVVTTDFPERVLQELFNSCGIKSETVLFFEPELVPP